MRPLETDVARAEPATRVKHRIEAWVPRIAAVAKGVPRVVAVYVFGSQVTGEAHEESDVDLGVLFAEPAGLDAVVDLEARFEEALGRSVDLVDLGACNAFLALDAIKGERVYCRDVDRCDEFDLYVMRRAADLEPFERERRRMLLEPRRRSKGP